MLCKVEYNDGGRAAAGYKGHVGDCVLRALCIATGEAYVVMRARIAEGQRGERMSSAEVRRGRRKDRSPDNGCAVHRQWFKDMMRDMGWVWTPTMGVGTGCKIHLRADELPSGTLIVRVSKHMCCVKDGVIYDTHDPSRAGTRCVYGYWSKPSQ